MGSFFKIILIGMLVNFQPAIASKGNQADVRSFIKKISATHNWTDLTKNLKDTLPSNVVKEISEASDGIDFPIVERTKSAILIKDRNGARVAIKLKGEGKVLLNDKEWRIAPLAPAQDEINRIAEFLENRPEKTSSIFSNFLPTAHAVVGSSYGISTMAYSISQAWKAESCGNKDLSDEQNKTCPLMAVGMQSANTNSNDNSKYLPIDLICPTTGNPKVLTLVSKNKAGVFKKLQVLYNDDAGFAATLYAAQKDAKFFPVMSINLRSETDATRIRAGKALISQSDSLKKGVCDADDKTKQRYFASLRENKNSLANTLPANFNGADEEAGIQDAI